MLSTTQKCDPLKQQGANNFLSWNIQTSHSAWCFYSWDGCFLLIWVHEICILWKQYYIKILSSCFTCYLLKSKLLVWDLFSGNVINQPATQMDTGHGETQVVKLAYYYSTFQLIFIIIETTFSLHSKSHEQNLMVKLFLRTATCQAFLGGTHLFWVLLTVLLYDLDRYLIHNYYTSSHFNYHWKTERSCIGCACV